MSIRIKRVYESPAGSDGFRVLVDRLWPRGMKREHAALDLWLKDIAPSPELRKWFDHDATKWQEFRRRYRRELDKKPELLEQIRQHYAAAGTLSLIYAARDEQHNGAVVLREMLEALVK